MGRVLRAFDPVRGHDVALKLLHVATPELCARIEREARALARIDHPNIARVYEWGELDGVPYLAMQYIDGVPLDVAARALPLAERMRLLVPVAEAIHAAHRLGFIHRDLKPSNILVQCLEDGQRKPWVLDFGLVHDAVDADLTAQGELLGTPGYLSPEQAAGEAVVDARSDVFSLGVILYELACGRAPFAADTAAAAVARVLRHVPPAPHRIDATVPRALGAIIERCLEKQPRERYPSALALAEDLDAWLAGRPIRARPRGAVGRALRWVAADRLRVALVATSAAVPLLAGIAWGLATLDRARALAAASSYTATALGIEREMWLATLWEGEDLARHRERLRARLAPIENAVRGPDSALRRVALGPYTQALEALGEHRRLLDLAADATPGTVDPGAAARFGRAYEREYQERLAALVTIADAERRQLAAARARADWLAPARAWLERAVEGGDTEDARLAAAALAVHAGDDAAALAAVESLPAITPTNRLAAAGIRLQRVLAAADGGDAGTLAQAIDEAWSNYEALAGVFPSAPQVWRGLCHLSTVRLRFSSRIGASDEPPPGRIEACERLCAADSADPHARTQRAKAYAALTRRATMVGGDPRPALALLRRDSDRDAELGARLALGEALVSASEYQRRHGPSADALLAEARALFARAETEAPADAAPMLAAAQADQLAAIYAPADDAEPLYAEAVRRLRRAVELEPTLSTRLRLAEVLAWQASARLHALEDPAAALAEARMLLDDAVAEHPQDLRVLQRLALVHWIEGQARSYVGGDGDPAYAAAEALYDRILAADPARVATAFNRASVQLARARERVRRGDGAAAILALVRTGLPALADDPVPSDLVLLAASWRLLQALDAQRGAGVETPIDPAVRGQLLLALARGTDPAVAAVQVVELWARWPWPAAQLGEFAADLARIDAAAADPRSPRIVGLHRARALAAAARRDEATYGEPARAALAVFAGSAYLRPYRDEFADLRPPRRDDPAAAPTPWHRDAPTGDAPRAHR